MSTTLHHSVGLGFIDKSVSYSKIAFSGKTQIISGDHFKFVKLPAFRYLY